MSADKYFSIFSRQMETIVYLLEEIQSVLQLFYTSPGIKKMFNRTFYMLFYHDPIKYNIETTFLSPSSR